MRKLLSIILALSLALSLSVPALAASGDVAYLAYNADTGEFDPQTKAEGEYTEVTGQTAWGVANTETWYVVNSEAADNLTISNRITVTGEVHLILADNCTLKAEKGITVNSGSSLTIYGQKSGTGTLTTGTPDQFYAGIGGGSMQSSGVITINGGTVTATSGSYGAGIGGGGLNQSGGTVTINGGTVKASSTGGAGIGGGYGGGGTVTINGGVVTATGGYEGAGIGGGYDGTVTVTINGGTVTATGGEQSAGIGGGTSGVGTVTISGGVVSATGGSYGAGIGDGGDGKAGTVTISGGTVNATGGDYGAGIGGGYGSSSATVTISGGFVTATGGTYGAGAAIGQGGQTGGSTGAEVAESNFNNAVVLRQSGASGSTMTGAVYGSPTLTADATVPSGITLAIPENATLTIEGNATLTNNGAITNSGTVINDGTIKGNAITGGGTFIAGGNIIIDENSKNQNGAASLAHEVAPAYIVTIPASVTIGNKATVKAEGVRVDYGKQVVVRLSGGSALTVALEGDPNETLDYTVSAGGQKVDAGGAVLAVDPDDATETALASGSAELAFNLAESAVVKYSGSYTGTVTFTVSVEQADSTGGTD